MRKWLAIARNEYRIRTSGIRRIRFFFPFIVIAVLAFYVFYIAPAIFELLRIELLLFFLSQTAVEKVQALLFMFFILFLTFPISLTLQQPQIVQQEIVLAAPVRPMEMLLGRFLGEMPLYSIFVALVAGSFAAVLELIGLDAVQMVITMVVFILIFMSAYWIGTVIAAILRSRLEKTAAGKDIGKALALVIALPMVAFMYAIMSGQVFEAFDDPEANGAVKILLGIMPSSWGADVIVSFATHPGDIGAVIAPTLAQLGGLVLFLIAAFWLGGKVADRAFNLEPSAIASVRAKPEGYFYRTVRYIAGGRAFGTLLVTIFKDYGRRLENISKIIYILGLLVLLNVFFYTGLEEEESDISIISILPSVFMLAFFAVFIMGEVTIRGKENLFIYRKAPRGESRLIRAKLAQGIISVVPMSLATMAIPLMFSLRAPVIDILLMFGFVVVVMTAYIILTLGLFLLNPIFTEDPRDLMANGMIVMMISIFSFIGSMIIFDIYWGMVSMATISWMLGLLLLFLGIKRLRMME